MKIDVSSRDLSPRMVGSLLSTVVLVKTWMLIGTSVVAGMLFHYNQCFFILNLIL